MHTKTVKSSHLRVVLKMALGRVIPSVVIYDVRNRGHSLLLRSFSAVLRRQMSTGILLIEYITKSVALRYTWHRPVNKRETILKKTRLFSS